MSLFGCLSGAANRVQQDFDVRKDYLGASGYVRRIANDRGVQLCAYFWPAHADVPMRGVVQLLHGNSTYIGFDFLKFQAKGLPNVYEGSWVQDLNRRGFSVCGIDHEGCGRSQGVRSYVRTFDTHVDNALLFAKHVRQCSEPGFPAGAPHFLLGYSLGGLVSVLVSLRQPGWFAGMVLLSPMISLERRAQETKHLRPLLKFLSAVTPRLQVGASTTEHPVEWIMEAWEADPLVYNGRMRARNAEEYFRVSEMVLAGLPGAGAGDSADSDTVAKADEGPEEQPQQPKQQREAGEAEADGKDEGGAEKELSKGGKAEEEKGAKKAAAKKAAGKGWGSGRKAVAASRGGLRVDCVSVPLLVFQGDRDTLVEPAGAEQLVRRAATHDKRLRVVPGAWHVLVKEQGNEVLLAETVQWLDEQCRTSRTLGLFRHGGGAAAAAAAPAGMYEAWAVAAAEAASKERSVVPGEGEAYGQGEEEDNESGEGEAPGGYIRAARAASVGSSVDSTQHSSALPGAIHDLAAAADATAAAAAAVRGEPSSPHRSAQSSSSSYTDESDASSSDSESHDLQKARSGSHAPPPPAAQAGSRRASHTSRRTSSGAESVEGLWRGDGSHGSEEVDGPGAGASSRGSSRSSLHLGQRPSEPPEHRGYSDEGEEPHEGRHQHDHAHHLPDSRRSSEAGASQERDSDRARDHARNGSDDGRRSGSGSVHSAAYGASAPYGVTAPPTPLPELKDAAVGGGRAHSGMEASSRNSVDGAPGHEQRHASNASRQSSHAESRWPPSPASRRYDDASAHADGNSAGARDDGDDEDVAAGHREPLLRQLPPLPPLATSGPSVGYSRYAPLPPIQLGSHAG